MRGEVSWKLPLLTGLAIAVVTTLPYLYGYLAQPHGQVFMGFFYLGDDANTYLAKMRQGWEGAWSWTNRYTTESSPSAYLFMFWIVLGHVAAVTHLPLIAVQEVERLEIVLLRAGEGAAVLDLDQLSQPNENYKQAFYDL